MKKPVTTPTLKTPKRAGVPTLPSQPPRMSAKQFQLAHGSQVVGHLPQFAPPMVPGSQVTVLPNAAATLPGGSEHAEQKHLMVWAATMSLTVPAYESLFAIPNGGQRTKAAAGKLKAEGVKPGVPDLFLAIARGKSKGLFIELKRLQNGRVSPDQAIWHTRLRGNGKAAKVALVACMRKLLTILNAMVRDGRRWSPPPIAGA